MVIWLCIAAVSAVAFLGWTLMHRLHSDRLTTFNDRRRATSRLVSCGVYVDGNRHLPVALAVTESTLFYENAKMQASLDLHWVRDIEYDNELSTGKQVDGGKVLRLRTVSQTFEFVLASDIVPRWHMMLPPRRAMEPAPSTLPVRAASAA